jgi:small subunit ribosomal protein S16
MLKIRLKQTGKKNAKQYRIIAIESTRKRDGKILELLGTYNPVPDKSQMTMDIEAADRLLKNGAQMTERVAKIYNLVKNNKVEK